MIKIYNFPTYFIIITFVSCNKQNTSVNGPKQLDSISVELYQPNDSRNNQISTSAHIKKIDNKKELRNDGSFNQMTLFEVDKNISIDELKNYCSTAKPKYKNGCFQILVFFNKSNTARFPENPITGMFLEDKDLKNIKAIYTINNINGYSKLDYYKKNELESIAQTIDID